MTSSTGTVDRIRWMSALVASAVLATAVAFGLHQWQLPSLHGGSAASAVKPAGSSAPLDPRIASIAAHHPQQVVSAIVQFTETVGPERARWDVVRAQGHVIGEVPIINALAVKLTAERARWLAADRDVHAVSLNATIKTSGAPERRRGQAELSGRVRLGGPGGPGGPGKHSVSARGLETTYDQTINAAGLWKAGDDGAGVGVAVIDTGIDGGLPDFQGSTGSRVIGSAVTNPDARTAADSYGHGTDVAGIIAGNGDNRPVSDPLHGDYVGVAPGANLISIKASDENGNATVLDVIYGLQFAIDHQWDLNIRVVNLSLDSQTPQSYATDPLDAAVEAAWMHGIVVVVAAGNRGNDSDAVQYAPANDPYVITVGAADEQGTPNPSDDVAAPWSSQGTTQDGFQKPDVYAPGAHIVSVLAPNSDFAASCPACLVGSEYIQTSGTSMAAPMISGLVADVLQAHPYWSPDQVKGALTSQAVATNALPEIDGVKLVGLQAPPRADTGLTPNQLINVGIGGIDYSRSTWSRSTWSVASGALSAAFARSSWSCACTPAPIASSGGGVGASRSSWSTHLNPTSANG